jgi:hypothetical protein
VDPGSDNPPNAEATDSAVAGPVATEPEAPAGPTLGSNRARWLIGGGIAVAAVAGLVLIVTLLGARPLPEALKYIPADSAVLIEVRPELPGDQRQHLGNFLAHFPGFADQSLLQTKIDEALARIVSESTFGEVDYTTQVKPLLAGPMAIGISSDGIAEMTSGRAMAKFLLVTTTEGAGATSCNAVFKATTVAETHRGVEVRSIDDSLSLSCAGDGRFILIGDIASIRAGLDARRDGKGIDTNSTYKSALATLDGDQLASIYVDGGALEELMTEVTELTGQTVQAGVLPRWTIAGLRVENDALIVDAHAPPVARALPSGAPTLAPASESRFAGSLPADTLGFIEVHGVGALTAQALAAMRADPASSSILDELETALQILGGTENIVSWIQDIGIAIVPTDAAVGGALLIRATDAAAASSRVAELKNLLVIASIGSDITVRNDVHNGIEVTSVDLGDVSDLLGAAGVDPGTVDVGRVQFAFAARGDTIVLAVGDGLIERILDVEDGSSLRTTDSYSRAVQLSGQRTDVQVYMAIDSVLALVERLVPASELESFNRDFKPYVDPLAATSVSSTNEAGSSSARIVLTVK